MVSVLAVLPSPHRTIRLDRNRIRIILYYRISSVFHRMLSVLLFTLSDNGSCHSDKSYVLRNSKRDWHWEQSALVCISNLLLSLVFLTFPETSADASENNIFRRRDYRLSHFSLPLFKHCPSPFHACGWNALYFLLILAYKPQNYTVILNGFVNWFIFDENEFQLPIPIQTSSLQETKLKKTKHVSWNKACFMNERVFLGCTYRFV